MNIRGMQFPLKTARCLGWHEISNRESIQSKDHNNSLWLKKKKSWWVIEFLGNINTLSKIYQMVKINQP